MLKFNIKLIVSDYCFSFLFNYVSVIDREHFISPINKFWWEIYKYMTSYVNKSGLPLVLRNFFQIFESKAFWSIFSLILKTVLSNVTNWKDTVKLLQMIFWIKIIEDEIQFYLHDIFS